MFEYVCGLAGVRLGKRGVTAVEYGIMAALIATILVAAVGTLGGGLKAGFSSIATHVSAGT